MTSCTSKRPDFDLVKLDAFLGPVVCDFGAINPDRPKTQKRFRRHDALPDCVFSSDGSQETAIAVRAKFEAVAERARLTPSACGSGMPAIPAWRGGAPGWAL